MSKKLFVNCNHVFSEETVKYLIEMGNDLNEALSWASSYGHLEIVKFLIQHGAKADYNALINASEDGHLEVVQYLIQHGVDPKDSEALIRASEEGHLEVVKYLISQGADPTTRDNLALKWASMNGHLEIVKLLLNYEIDLHYYEIALCFASQYGHLEIVKFLVEFGIDPSCRSNSAIKIASKNGYSDIVKFLLKDSRVNPEDDSNFIRWIPLDNIMIGDYPEIDIRLNLPISLASKYGHSNIVEILLKRVNPSINNNEPISEACNYNQIKVVKILLQDPRVDATNIISDDPNIQELLDEWKYHNCKNGSSID